MTAVHKIDGILAPFQTVRMNGGPGGVEGLPSSAAWGAIGTAGITFEDPTGALNLIGWHTYTFDETACTTAPRQFTGWIFGRAVSRGEYVTGPGRVWDCDIIDQNALFGFEVFRASSAKRPAETDLVRAQFAIDSAPMAGTPVAVTSRTNLTDNPRNFGDSDYVTQYPIELFNSITAPVGKNFYAYWDEGEQAIGLHYDVVGANPASTLRLSNVLSDVLASPSDTFAPSRDAVLERSSENIFTGVLFGYRGAYAYGRRQTTIDAYSPTEFSPNEWRRDQVYRSDRPGVLATVLELIETMLDERALESDTITVTVQLPAAVCGLLHAGMSVEVKFSHLPGYETFTFVEVRERDIKPSDGSQDLYDVRLVLSNAARQDRGPGGGTGGEFPHAPCENPSIVQTIVGPTGADVQFDEAPTVGHTLFCFQYSRDTSLDPPTCDFGSWTLLEETAVVGGFTRKGWAWWRECLDPSESYDLPSVDKAYVLIETDAVDATPTAVNLDTQGPSLTFECGGSVTPTAGAGALIIGMAVVGTSDSDFDGPAGSRAAPASGVTEIGDSWGGQSPLRWAGYREVAAASGSYTIEATIESSWTAKLAGGITIVLEAEGGDCCPDASQWVENEVVTLVGADGVTACPFADNSLHVFIDNVEQTATLVSQDGATGAFTMGFDPTPTEVCTVMYQGR